MNNIIYGFVDENNRLINTSVIVENDIETLERVKLESRAVAAYPMDSSKELLVPEKSYWNGTRFLWDSPYPSWVWNEELNDWESPYPYPIDEKVYTWNEDTVSWEEVLTDSI